MGKKVDGIEEDDWEFDDGDDDDDWDYDEEDWEDDEEDGFDY